MLWKAHLDLETLVMDLSPSPQRDVEAPKIAQLIYSGFWFSPEMAFLMAAIEKSQENIEGKVFLKLYKGNVIIVGREVTKISL